MKIFLSFFYNLGIFYGNFFGGICRGVGSLPAMRERAMRSIADKFFYRKFVLPTNPTELIYMIYLQHLPNRQPAKNPTAHLLSHLF